MDNPFIAMIMIWAPNFAPQDWAFCHGQQLQVAQNQALYSLIGTTYGGSGATNFNLPNLQGRIPLGVGNLPGGSSYMLGQVAGSEETTLTINNMPMHNHDGTGLQAQTQAWDTAATDQSPSSGKGLAAAQSGSPVTPQAVRAYADPSGNPVNLAGGSVSGMTGVTGGSAPFSNMQPYLALNFCIALTGLYPMRPN